MDSSRKTRWWMIGVAALLAGIFLWESFGLIGAGVVLAGLIALISMEARRTSPGSRTSRCLRCGEILKPNARQCDSCGSASWTVN